MIEAYAFLGAFTVQIVTTSILYPTWFIRYVRLKTTSLPLDRLAQLYPGVDVGQVQGRFLAQYRALNTGFAVLGSLLLAWLFSYTRRPDWDDGLVEILVVLYFLVAQMLPMGIVGWLGVKFNREHKRLLLEAKRKATLQRRGLFDFVSPLAVGLAVLSYFLFAALVFYIREHPFTGFAGLVNIAGITLVYAFNGALVYTMLYGKNKNPFDTPASRLHAMGVAVKSSVYSCIVVAVYLSLTFLLALLELQRWEPFALSIFCVICALLSSMGVLAPLREPEVDELGSNPLR